MMIMLNVVIIFLNIKPRGPGHMNTAVLGWMIAKRISVNHSNPNRTNNDQSINCGYTISHTHGVIQDMWPLQPVTAHQCAAIMEASGGQSLAQASLC
jgi:hypothetical protein